MLTPDGKVHFPNCPCPACTPKRRVILAPESSIYRIGIELELRGNNEDGWRVYAVPERETGWEPIPLTRTRGTHGGALVELACAFSEFKDRGD